MPAIDILPAESSAKPFELMEAWHANPGAVPWVHVGNLFLSCFETGETSWHPVVELLAKAPHNRKSFTVCTGRHGDFVVKADSGSGQFTGVADSAHLGEDLQGIAQVKQRISSDVDIMVVDVADPDFNTIPRLQGFLQQHISAGRTVVLAWCYSIFAMNAVSTDATDAEIQALAPELKAVSIQQLVEKHWGFAT